VRAETRHIRSAECDSRRRRGVLFPSRQRPFPRAHAERQPHEKEEAAAAAGAFTRGVARAAGPPPPVPPASGAHTRHAVIRTFLHQIPPAESCHAKAKTMRCHTRAGAGSEAYAHGSGRKPAEGDSRLVAAAAQPREPEGEAGRWCAARKGLFLRHAARRRTASSRIGEQVLVLSPRQEESPCPSCCTPRAFIRARATEAEKAAACSSTQREEPLLSRGSP